MRIRIPLCAAVLAVIAGCHPEEDTSTAGVHLPPVQEAGSGYPASLKCAGVELILVPQGQRLIGTINTRARPWERPMLKFTLDYVLYMGKTEITAGQHRRLIPKAVDGKPMMEGYKDDEPATTVWEYAKDYCREYGRALERKTGRKWICRLPREAEWEYAARYGRPQNEDWWPARVGFYDPQLYDLWDHAWYSKNSGGWIHPVAQLKPNALGLYDMLGNVPEWCEGWRTDSVESMLSHGWKEDCPRRFLRWLDSRPARGGDYMSEEDDCRPSSRDPMSVCGFRIVVEPSPLPKAGDEEDSKSVSF